MPLPASEALSNHLSLPSQKYEAKSRCIGTKDVPIRSLERGAGYHQPDASVFGLTDSRRERAKPSCTVFIREWNSTRHPLHVLGGVVLIPFDKVDA